MRKSLLTLAAAAALLAGAAQAETATYAIDPTHTFATFEIGHFGTTTNRGRFDKKEGSVQLDRAAKTGKVEITIDTDLRSTPAPPPSTSTCKAPTCSTPPSTPPSSSSPTSSASTATRCPKSTGNLTLLGKTQPVTLKASQFNCYTSPMLKREVCGGDFETTIDRTAFGMNYGIDWGFPKNVRLVIQVEAVKQ